MRVIKIEGTDDTPQVTFDANPENSFMEISGLSLMENPGDFYDLIMEWFFDYEEDPLEKTVLNLKFEMMSSATQKRILNLLYILEDMHEAGKDILVRWHYPDDDEDIEELGERFEDIVEIPFEQVSYSTD